MLVPTYLKSTINTDTAEIHMHQKMYVKVRVAPTPGPPTKVEKVRGIR